MSPEAQRIAIAGACGWKPAKSPVGESSEQRFWWSMARRHLPWLPEDQRIIWWHSPDDLKANGGREVGASISPIPDYLNDLNAMRGAMLSLFGILRVCPERGPIAPMPLGWDLLERQDLSDAYLRALQLIMSRYSGYDSTEFYASEGHGSRLASFANAVQQAEAFLRVIGKWVED